MKSINDVLNAYLNKEYDNQLKYPDIPKFKDTHIFDEDKSVKWNREQVQVKNKEREEEIKKYREESSRLSAKLSNDCQEAIMYEYGFNKEEAGIIYNYAYQEKHSSMTDVFYFCEELSDLYEKLLKTKNK